MRKRVSPMRWPKCRVRWVLLWARCAAPAWKFCARWRSNALRKTLTGLQQTERVLRFLREQCGVQPEYPWADEPSYAVFRHAGNRKWFAVLMGLDGSRVDPALTGRVEILNLKASPVQITKWVERGRVLSRLSHE